MNTKKTKTILEKTTTTKVKAPVSRISAPLKEKELRTPVIDVLSHKDLGIGSIKEDDAIAQTKNFSLWIRVARQNMRQGTVGCKTRGEVARTGKKPWKQKGTGRARAGTSRSPLWRGGGVIFGPQPRTRTLKISRVMRQGVLRALLNEYLNQKNVCLLKKTIEGEKPSTRQAVQLLKACDLQNKKINLFVSAQDMIAQSSFANLPNVQLFYFDQPNAYDLVRAERWLIFEKDLAIFKEMVKRWH